MVQKKKKPSKGKGKAPAGRRTSQSDFIDEDSLLQEILAGSNKTATTPGAPNELASASSSSSKKKKGSTVGASLLSQLAQDEEEPQDLSQLKAANTPSVSTTAVEVTGKEVKCPHAKQAMNAMKLRRQIAQLKDLNKCHGCDFEYGQQIRAVKRMASLSEIMAEMALKDVVEPEPLALEAAWMCLSCCEINCGRAVKKHAVKHADDGKGNHPLTINLSNMECWCYECDQRIVPSKNRNQSIAEFQSIVEKALQTKQLKQRAANAALAKKSKSTVVESKPSNTIKVYTPGLQNLGNTCFFNSVMQVLTETRTLRQILSDKPPSNTTDGVASEDNEEKKEATKEEAETTTADSHPHQVSLPLSLAATTDAGLGPLTSTFKALLHTMWRQQGATVTPRDLFTQIIKKWKVFRGFRQQDSQELMRYLFDGLEQEERDLIKRHVAEQQQQQAPEEVDTEKPKKMKGKKGEQGAVTKYTPFIESCFSGKLVSVIVCDACKKCSYSYEPYFDLSLPVKSARGMGPSGTSMKDKPRARALGNHSLSDSASVDSESTLVDKEQQEKDVVPVEEQGSSAHLEHVQKLLKTIESRKSMDELSIERSLVQFTSVDVLDDDNKFACENCYKILRGGNDQKSEGEQESVQQEEQEEEKEANKADTKAAKEEEECTKEEGSASEEADKDISEEEPKMEVDAAESDDEEEEEEDEVELTDSLGNTIERPLKKKAAVAATTAASSATAVAKAGKESKPKPEPKYLMRKAFKRYLVASLPPTLVLHLKRFETAGSRFGMMRKIDDHVDIPEELDMSPFCIPKKVIEEEDEKKDKKEGEDDDDDDEETVVVDDQENVSKKYRLYGIVVHQGTLGSGHYTNYVLSSKVEDLNAKVEAMNKASAAAASASTSAAAASAGSTGMPDIPLSEILAQQQAKKKGGKKGKGVATPTAATAAAATVAESAAGEVVPVEENAVDTRQWLYCSDTHVRLSSLEEALASNAYLLFYERV
ncbi:Ubiquitin carboxyl-terminal hydrolase 16 [Actinomortierella ambigua]|nr:Ubiquitin carboxyl-terminal hydrolase 16 [Actinomortierella ambigua]